MIGSKDQTNHAPSRWTLLATALLILVLVSLLLAETQIIWLRWIAIMAIAWWLPGALLVAHWRLPKLDLPTAVTLATGLGLCWMMLVALLVHWLPGPIERWLLAAAYGIGAFVLLMVLVWRRPTGVSPALASTWGWLAALLVLAAVLRLPGLGYHEFHIDEVEVLRRARWAIEGADDVLAVHSKGPGEIAVAMVVYRALGTTNEAMARLPFALMSVAAVLATALLGRRLFSPTVGLWAGVLLAANGFALGLSRIVQYQPAVLLLSVLSVLSAWEFAQRGESRWLALAAAFSAFGVVLHYEFAFLAPALLVLAWMGWKRASDKRSVLFTALSAAVTGAILVAATYVPLVLDPHFAKTQGRLSTRLGGFGAINIGFFVEMGTFYNSTYFFAGLLVLVFGGIILGWVTARRRTLLLALWFLPLMILHLFVMQLPGTHFYVLMPSWSLLAALPLAALTGSRVIRPVVRWGSLALVLIWLAVSGGYLYLVFFRQAPEYVVNYHDTRLPFYWAPYGEDIPQDPRFGFPIQEGWKTLGTLAEWGCLRGTYATNEGLRFHEGWYLPMLDHVKFEESPDLLFLVKHVQGPHPGYDETRLEGYQRVGEVRVRNEPRIEVWSREPLPLSYVTYNLEEFTTVFDGTVPTLEDWPDPPAQVHGIALGDMVTLESAGLSRTTLTQGDTLHLLLVWRPEQTMATDYKVFVHVADEKGRPVAQWDGLPCLNMARTSQWAVGEAVKDHVLLTIPADVPPGQYTVLAGLYEETTGERLGGQAVEIATIVIR